MELQLLINQYLELKKESIGPLRTVPIVYTYTNLCIRRIYSNGDTDIIVRWPDEYSAKLWLNSHINKFLDDKYPKSNYISEDKIISPLMEVENV